MRAKAGQIVKSCGKIKKEGAMMDKMENKVYFLLFGAIPCSFLFGSWQKNFFS